jgi:hypothetical protein
LPKAARLSQVSGFTKQEQCSLILKEKSHLEPSNSRWDIAFQNNLRGDGHGEWRQEFGATFFVRVANRVAGCGGYGVHIWGNVTRAVIVAAEDASEEVDGAAGTARESQARPGDCHFGHIGWECPCFAEAVLAWWQLHGAGARVDFAQLHVLVLVACQEVINWVGKVREACPGVKGVGFVTAARGRVEVDDGAVATGAVFVSQVQVGVVPVHQQFGENIVASEDSGGAVGVQQAGFGCRPICQRTVNRVFFGRRGRQAKVNARGGCGHGLGARGGVSRAACGQVAQGGTDGQAVRAVREGDGVSQFGVVARVDQCAHKWRSVGADLACNGAGWHGFADEIVGRCEVEVVGHKQAAV